MRNPFKANTAENFFWQWAGWSHPSGAGSMGREHARAENARALARAEREAVELGYSVEWSQDDMTDADFRDTDEPYLLWEALVRDETGTVQGSMGGVDFGPPPADPWDGNTYRRVVEAELAREALAGRKQA